MVAVQGHLHLRSGVRYYFEVRVSRSTIHVTMVAEQIGCAPQELGTASGLFLLQVGR